MKILQYLFVQIEVFVMIVEIGSLLQVVICLVKDWIMLCDLLDYLEDVLGYWLFSCEGCSLMLIVEGEQLFCQVYLLLCQVQVFEFFV